MSANDAIPRIEVLAFLEIWYCVQAQLLADGVPRDCLKGFGPLQLAMEFRRQSLTFWHQYHIEDLPSWQSDPIQDGYTVKRNDDLEMGSSTPSRFI
jgi:hypothetical protein